MQYLLADHDEQVKRFAQAVNELKQNDPDGHVALFAYIGEINQLLVAQPTTH